MTQKKSFAQHLIAVSVGLALFVTVTGTSARLGPVAAGQSPDVERTARVLTPRSMPAETTLSFKVKNVESPNWLQDLEIEVQNNFSQPIYFLMLHLTFPNLPRRQIEGVLRKQVVSVKYGRWQLMQPGQFATSADLPIKPGETHVFQISESDRDGFESALGEMGVTKSLIKRIEIEIYLLSFGDGTGYRMGTRFPSNPSKVSRIRARDRPEMAHISSP